MRSGLTRGCQTSYCSRDRTGKEKRRFACETEATLRRDVAATAVSVCAILHVFSCPVSVLHPRYYTGRMPIKPLFFDFGNTLLFPNRIKILAPLHQRQLFPSTALL